MAESGEAIDKDYDEMVKQWAQGLSYDSGMYFGQMEKTWYDTIEKFPKYVPAEFAHGWYFGITGERLEFSEDTL